VYEAATLEQERVLLYDNEVGARVESSNDMFPGKARLKGDELHAVKCKTPLEGEGKRRKTQGQIVSELSRPALEPLRTQVLQLPSWDALDKAIAGRLKGALQ
jgi:hypothetical protein